MKKILSILVIIMLILSFSITSNAVEDSVPGQYINEIDEAGSSSEEIETIAGKILGVLQTVGIVVAVVMLLVIGIKYMMGSVEEKSKYKTSMAPYLIGAVVVFATVNITKIIYDVVNQINKK